MRNSLFVLVVAALVSMTSCAKPQTGDLIEQESLSKLTKDYEWPIGDFLLLRRQSEQGPVYQWKQKGQILAESVAGKSFLTGGVGSESVKESRGSFQISDKTKLRCDRQSVDSIESNTSDTLLVIRGSLICTDKSQVAYQMIFQPASDQRLRFDVRTYSKDLNRLELNLASTADEGFFGFGEQFSYFNLKGRRLPILVQEQGIGRGAQPITLGANLTAGAGGDWHTSYAGLPHYMTSRMRSLFLENSEYAIFDMTAAEKVSVQIFSNRLTGQFVSGKDPKELVEGYTDYAGRMKSLPDWLHRGAIVGLQGGTDVVRKRLAELKKHKVPLAALWLQDWVGQRTTSFGRQLWWNWQLDQNHYPGWTDLAKDLRGDQIRLMAYVNPFIADVASVKPNLQRNLFAEAEKNQYFVLQKDQAPYLILNTDFHAGLIDLTNPKAYRWLKDVIKNEMLQNGVSGYMADFGEALPFDSVLFSGEPAASYHNRYPVEWARLNRELADEWQKDHGGEEIVFFMRSAYTGSQRYSRLFWLGDQLVSFDEHDGIKTAVTGLLSGGLSGYSINHSDIGGYTAITNPIKNYHRSKELLLRWTEMAAFQPVFRTHEGNRPAENFQIYDDEETLEHFGRFARIYTALFDYRKTLFQQAERYGWPVVRPLWFTYPDDKTTQSIRYESFMLGSDLLVAPVLDQGKTTVSVYLPQGNWIHVWSAKQYAGGATYEIEAPIGQPAVFVLQSNPALYARLKKTITDEN